MKNKLFTLALILVSALTITSCASRKYGCPNSTGMHLQATSPVHAAV